MKAFFKKYPEVLILSIIVLIADVVIIYSWTGDVAATQQAKEKHLSLQNDAKAINESEWRINTENANNSKKETEKWVGISKDLFLAQQTKYRFSVDYDRSSNNAKAAEVFKNKVKRLSQEILKEKDKNPNDALSFKGYVYENKMFNMSPNDIQTLFEILRGVEELVDICVKSDVIEIEQILRPKELVYEADSALNTKRYTYHLRLTAYSEGMKKLFNLLAQNEGFFFDVLSFKITSENQVSSSATDIVPVVQKTDVKAKSTGTKELNLNKLPEGLDGLSSTEPVNEGPVILEQSVSPFREAVYTIELVIDWVQFVKEN